MVAPKDWLRGQGAAAGSLRDALAAIRAEHGKGARAYLANLAGVSKDTAGRWLSGKQMPSSKAAGRHAAIKGAGSRIKAAKRIRQMRSIKPRMVAVVSISPSAGNAPDGHRQIDTTITLGPMSDRIADAWERGDEDGAADMLSAALIAGYNGEDPSDDSGLASILEISDFAVDPEVDYDE
jgi:hypothetical protein